MLGGMHNRASLCVAIVGFQWFRKIKAQHHTKSYLQCTKRERDRDPQRERMREKRKREREKERNRGKEREKKREGSYSPTLVRQCLLDRECLPWPFVIDPGALIFSLLKTKLCIKAWLVCFCSLVAPRLKGMPCLIQSRCHPVHHNEQQPIGPIAVLKSKNESILATKMVH